MWIWNEKPELRYLCFTTRNNLTMQEGDLQSKIKMGQMKAMGTVKGTTDLIFYFAGRLYGFDMKVGKDKLSKEQLEFLAKLRSNGGGGCEIRSLDQFKEEIESILKSGQLTCEE
jgi:hypothetical protein